MPSLSAATESSSSVSEISIEELGLFKIFDEFPAEKLTKIRSIMKVEQGKVDEVVILDADVGDTFYLLLDGEVEVSKALVMRMSRQDVLNLITALSFVLTSS